MKEGQSAFLWRFYRRFYFNSFSGLGLSIALSIVQSLLVLLIAYLIRHLLDNVLPEEDLNLLFLMGAGIVLLYFTNSAVALGGRYWVLKSVRSGTQRLRTELLKKYYSLSRSVYCRLDMGIVHARLVEDTAWLNTMTDALIAKLFPSTIICVTLATLLIFLNHMLFLIIFSVTPILMLTNSLVNKRLGGCRDEYRRADHLFSKGMLFALQMIDLTKIQTAETFETKRQAENIQRLSQTGTSFFWLQAVYHEVQGSIVTTSGILILLVGGWSVSRGTMTIGELLSFYVVVGLLSKYLNVIWTSIPHIVSGQRSLTSLYEFLEKSDIPVYSGRKRIPFGGEITFKKVSFNYGNRSVLEEIDLEISPNTTVAFFGPNGAGKTTIAYLIMGLYRPLSGRVLADGHSYDELDIMHLRSQMSMVTQDPTFFHGTLIENISYGCPDAHIDDVVRAARLAAAHDFIQELPQGYRTTVGDKGVLLSGGQRQRVALARALLRRPRLLLLDEPTNHLDLDAVRQLMGNLKTIDFRPSVLIITHDRDVLREADHIYQLDKGRILTGRDSQMRVSGI